MVPKIEIELDSQETSVFEVANSVERTPSTSLTKFKQPWLSKDKEKYRSHILRFKKIRHSEKMKMKYGKPKTRGQKRK